MDNTKSVKFSAKTLRENRGMIKREYQAKISELTQKMELLNKEIGFDKFVFLYKFHQFQRPIYSTPFISI